MSSVRYFVKWQLYNLPTTDVNSLGGILTLTLKARAHDVRERREGDDDWTTTPDPRDAFADLRKARAAAAHMHKHFPESARDIHVVAVNRLPYATRAFSPDWATHGLAALD